MKLVQAGILQIKLKIWGKV